MQIDVKTDSLLKLSEARKLRWLPGGKVAYTSIHRWATQGVRGIILENVKVGGSRCTTEAAMLRFFERLAAPPEEKPTKARRKKAIDRANDILDNAGI